MLSGTSLFRWFRIRLISLITFKHFFIADPGHVICPPIATAYGMATPRRYVISLFNVLYCGTSMERQGRHAYMFNYAKNKAERKRKGGSSKADSERERGSGPSITLIFRVYHFILCDSGDRWKQQTFSRAFGVDWILMGAMVRWSVNDGWEKWNSSQGEWP